MTSASWLSKSSSFRRFFGEKVYNNNVMSLLRKFRHLFDPIDLTKGDIKKIMLAFMIPIMLSMFFQQIYTLTDTIICGQNLGADEIAGINDAATLVYFALDLATGCASGFSVILAKKIGERNPDEGRKSFLVSILLGTILSVIITIVAIACIDPLLSWLNIFPSATDIHRQALYEAARSYLFVMYLGTIAIFAYNLIIAALRAMGDAFTPFLFLVFSTVLNIGLDLLFIVVFSWGVTGAAVATVISQALAAFGSFIYAFVRYPMLRFRKGDMHFTFRFVMDHLRLGLPLGFQYSILAIGIVLMQAAVIAFDIDPNGLAVAGMPAQLGYGVANKVGGLLITPLTAMGAGMLDFMGQNLGAKNYARIRKGFEVSMVIGTVTWLLLSTIGLLLTINGAYQYIFLSADEVTAKTISFGNMYLYISMPFMGFLMVLFICRNSLQGLERPLFPFLAGIGELLARSLICLFLPALVNGGPISSATDPSLFWAVAIADPTAWIVASLTLAIPFIIDVYVKAPDRMKKKQRLPR